MILTAITPTVDMTLNNINTAKSILKSMIEDKIISYKVPKHGKRMFTCHECNFITKGDAEILTHIQNDHISSV